MPVNNITMPEHIKKLGGEHAEKMYSIPLHAKTPGEMYSFLILNKIQPYVADYLYSEEFNGAMFQDWDTIDYLTLGGISTCNALSLVNLRDNTLLRFPRK